MGFFDFLKNINSSSKFTVQKPTKTNQTIEKIVVPERQQPQPHYLHSCKEIPRQTTYEAHFKNGILFNVIPRNRKLSLYEDRQTAYDARYIISDGVKYDLENINDIKNIRIPQFQNNKGISSPTMNLDYILKMRVNVENRPNIAVYLAYKVANLMISSPIGWGKKDYYRLVIQLWSIGEIYYGDFLLEQLKKLVPVISQEDEIKYISNKSFDNVIKYAKQMQTDYIQIGYSGCICSECAPYQNRIYSLSGKDKRFPKLPDFIIKDKGLHCNISIDAVLYYAGDTITQYTYKNTGNVSSKEVDAVKYSNRPFIDDRSTIEKENYINHEIKIAKQKDAEENYYSRDYWINDYNNHYEYQALVNKLGDKAPRSYSGYKRMKKNNTANYQKLLQFAKENNISIN